MENEDQLKETHIKNRTCFYFDDKIKDRGIYSVNILLHEKSYIKHMKQFS